MVRLDRVTAKVFADSAPAGEIGQFGSALLGTKVLTDDVATIQGLSAYDNGWGSAVISNRNYPTMQEFNGLLKVMSYQTAYQMQEGIPEYDASTTYYTGSIVKVISGTDTLFYQSLVDNNTGYAVTNTNYWFFIRQISSTEDYMDRPLEIEVPLGTGVVYNALTITGSNIDFTTPPATQLYYGMVEINDSNDNRMGRLEYMQDTDGKHSIRLVDKESASESHYAILEVGYDSNGNQYCSFPDTRRVDGQWIPNLITVATNVSVNGSTNLTYTISSLPSNGYNYEILLSARGQGSTTDNQYCPIYVGTSLTADNYVMIAGSRQQGTTANTFGGSGVVPIGTDRKLYLTRSTGYYGTVQELVIRAYRRIGGNA